MILHYVSGYDLEFNGNGAILFSLKHYSPDDWCSIMTAVQDHQQK